MKKDNNRNRRKKTEESEDILSMIRKRQEQRANEGPPNNSKLRQFLEGLDTDEVEMDYTDSPIYKLGYEDGYNEAEEIYSNKFNVMRNSLKSLLIDL